MMMMMTEHEQIVSCCSVANDNHTYLDQLPMWEIYRIHPGQLSLPIPPWVDAVGTSQWAMVLSHI